jgi:hypothetical protein
MEHTPSPPLLRDGALYACTNLAHRQRGCYSGRMRWVTGHYFMRGAPAALPTTTRTATCAGQPRPQIAGGSLIVMPLDAQQLLALDPSTGHTR